MNKIHKNSFNKYNFSHTFKCEHTKTSNDENKIHGCVQSIKDDNILSTSCKENVETNVNKIHKITYHINKNNNPKQNGFSHSCKNVNTIHKYQQNLKYVHRYYGLFIDANKYFLGDDVVLGNNEMTRVTCICSSVHSNFMKKINETIIPLNLHHQHGELNKKK